MLRQLGTAVVFVFAGCVAPASAQGGEDPDVRPLLQNVTRAEAWSFFTPPAGGGDPDYTLVSNRARLGVALDARRLALEGSFQYSQIRGLPAGAFGPGPLGPGALYFFSAQTPEAFQLYIKSASLTVKNVLPRTSVRVGRMPYQSGEGTPHAARLLGEVEWTPFERSFDGVRVDYRGDVWSAHGAFVMPTQGAFEESASPTMGKVQVVAIEVSTRAGQTFAYNYRDTRTVNARPDNTGISVRAADVAIQTLGASATVLGIDLWGAWQRGDWYGQAHRAFSASASKEHRWTRTRGRPGVRGGATYASGDPDADDNRHGTFFPMLPTTRPDLLRGTVAQMNLVDLFGGASFSPHERAHIRADLHYLQLANRRDRWYSGSGATAFDGGYFGFSSRGSTLRSGLGTFVQVQASARLARYWTMTASAGMLRGGDVVQRQFAGRTATVLAVESVVQFTRQPR